MDEQAPDDGDGLRDPHQLSQAFKAAICATISLDPVLDLLRQAGVRATDFAPEIAAYLYEN